VGTEEHEPDKRLIGGVR